ncbi:MAG TPA: hypothetical protein VHU86_04495 [Solirubrobacterales bacterium]|jgi:hypothetical protein|nr:hypothetical protein [Solirubrobacterales bacterium]
MVEPARDELKSHVPSGVPTATVVPLTGERRRRAFLRRLREMGPAERREAWRRGAFTHAERNLWAARYPEEAPLVNDELVWIALNLADLD